MAGGLLGKAKNAMKNRGKQIDRAVNRAVHPNNGGPREGQDFHKVDQKFQQARAYEEGNTPWGRDELASDKKKGR